MLMRFNQLAQRFGVANLDSTHPRKILLRGAGC
jgi:hypothetical protein